MAETATERKLRRSKYQPTGRWIRPEKRASLYERDGYKCKVCKKDLSDADPQDITLDHIVSRRDGGSNEPENLRTCCRTCNCSHKEKSAVSSSDMYEAVLDRIGVKL